MHDDLTSMPCGRETSQLTAKGTAATSRTERSDSVAYSSVTIDPRAGTRDPNTRSAVVINRGVGMRRLLLLTSMVSAQRHDVLPSYFRYPCVKRKVYTACEHNGYYSVILLADSR